MLFVTGVDGVRVSQPFSQNLPPKMRQADIEKYSPPALLIFDLRTDTGNHLPLDLVTLHEALTFAAEEGLLSPFLDSCSTSSDDLDRAGIMLTYDGSAYWISPRVLFQCLEIAARSEKLPHNFAHLLTTLTTGSWPLA